MPNSRLESLNCMYATLLLPNFQVHRDIKIKAILVLAFISVARRPHHSAWCIRIVSTQGTLQVYETPPTTYPIPTASTCSRPRQSSILYVSDGPRRSSLSLSLPNRLRPHLAGAACAPTRIYCVTLAISAAMVGHRGSRSTALHSETWVTVWRSSCSSINLYSLRNGSSTKTQQYKHKYKENVSED